MPVIKGRKKVDEVHFKIMDIAYKKLQFKKWCERYIVRWNSLPNAAQLTVEECMENKFIILIYRSKNIPSRGVAPVSFNSPEEAADLVMDYRLSSS